MAARSARKTRNDRRQEPPDKGTQSLVSWPRLVPASCLVAVAVAVYLIAQSAQRKDLPISDANPLDGPERPSTELPAESWGPAYSPKATADDMLAEARRVAERMATTYPENPTALGVLARLRYALGESQQAVELWQRGVALDPAYADGYFGIGSAALRRGEFAKAVEALERAAALTPGDPRVVTSLAAAWIGLGQVEKAVAVLEKSAEAGPLPTDASIILGQAYLDQQQYEKAQRAYEQLIRQSPQEPKAYYGLARSCLRLGRRDEARQHMQRFQEFQQLRVEDERTAAHSFSDAATSRGLLVQTLMEAAAVHTQSADSGQAERLWQGVARLEPKHVAARRQLLRLYQSLGRNRDALAAGEQLCEIEPASAEHWFQVALLHGWLEEFDAALAAVDRALALDPENASYRQARDVIRSGKGL